MNKFTCNVEKKRIIYSLLLLIFILVMGVYVSAEGELGSNPLHAIETKDDDMAKETDTVTNGNTTATATAIDGDQVPTEVMEDYINKSVLLENVGDFIVGSVVIILIMVVAFISMKFYKNKINSLFRKIQNLIVEKVLIFISRKKVDNIYDEIKLLDPGFSKEKIHQLANNMFVCFVEAWEKKNWRILRTFESDELFNLHAAKLQDIIDKNQTWIQKEIKILRTDILSFGLDQEVEKLHVRFRVRLLEYRIDDKTDRLIEGSKDKACTKDYIWVLVRKRGLKSDLKKQNTKALSCANCGSNLSINALGECEKCQMNVSNGDFGWVLSVIESEAVVL